MSQDPRPATDPTSLASLAEWAAAEAHLLLPQPAEWLADREHRRSLEAITSCLRPAPTLQFFGDQRPAAAPPHPGPPTSAAPGAAAPPQDPPPPAPAAAPPLHQRRPGHATRGALLTSIFAEATGRGAMDESLGTQIATSAVPFNRGGCRLCASACCRLRPCCAACACVPSCCTKQAAIAVTYYAPSCCDLPCPLSRPPARRSAQHRAPGQQPAGQRAAGSGGACDVG